MFESRRRNLLLICVAGIFCTGISALFPWEFCMGGDARGFPLAIVRPSHGDGILAIPLRPTQTSHYELSVPSLLGDVLLYGFFVGFPLLLIAVLLERLWKYRFRHQRKEGKGAV
jgi:hypothetical protein